MATYVFVEDRSDKRHEMITPGIETIRAQQATSRSMNEGLNRLVEDWKAEVGRLADKGFPIRRL